MTIDQKTITNVKVEAQTKIPEREWGPIIELFEKSHEHSIGANSAIQRQEPTSAQFKELLENEEITKFVVKEGDSCIGVFMVSRLENVAKTGVSSTNWYQTDREDAYTSFWQNLPQGIRTAVEIGSLYGLPLKSASTNNFGQETANELSSAVLSMPALPLYMIGYGWTAQGHQAEAFTRFTEKLKDVAPGELLIYETPVDYKYDDWQEVQKRSEKIKVPAPVAREAKQAVIDTLSLDDVTTLKQIEESLNGIRIGAQDYMITIPPQGISLAKVINWAKKYIPFLDKFNSKVLTLETDEKTKKILQQTIRGYEVRSKNRDRKLIDIEILTDERRKLERFGVLFNAYQQTFHPGNPPTKEDLQAYSKALTEAGHPELFQQYLDVYNRTHTEPLAATSVRKPDTNSIRSIQNQSADPVEFLRVLTDPDTTLFLSIQKGAIAAFWITFSDTVAVHERTQDIQGVHSVTIPVAKRYEPMYYTYTIGSTPDHPGAVNSLQDAISTALLLNGISLGGDMSTTTAASRRIVPTSVLALASLNSKIEQINSYIQNLRISFIVPKASMVLQRHQWWLTKL